MMHNPIQVAFVVWLWLVAVVTCQVTDPTAVSVGDQICYEGFVMDNFCIARGTLLDEPSTTTLLNPERHSVHCLIDVVPCYTSNYELLAAPVDGETLYTRAFQLTDDGKAGIIGVAAAVSAVNPTDSPFPCTECTGTMGDLGRGFRAMVHGIVTEAAQADGTPATIHIVDAAATHDRQGEEFCTGAFPADQNEDFGQALPAPAAGGGAAEPGDVTTVTNAPVASPPVATVPAAGDVPMGKTDPATVTVGDNICFEGFVMDYFCIDRGTLLDRPDVETLIGPEEHSVSCLIKVAVCRSSAFVLLEAPVEGETMYTRAFQFDGSSKEGLISIADESSLAKGFRAEVYGVVKELTDPPTIEILDAFESEGVANPCMRASVPEQNPIFEEVESEAPAVGDTSTSTGSGTGAAEVAFMAIAFVAVAALGVVSVFGDKIFPKSN